MQQHYTVACKECLKVTLDNLPTITRSSLLNFLHLNNTCYVIVNKERKDDHG
jgi:hypothetical protein